MATIKDAEGERHFLQGSLTHKAGLQHSGFSSTWEAGEPLCLASCVAGERWPATVWTSQSSKGRDEWSLWSTWV